MIGHCIEFLLRNVYLRNVSLIFFLQSIFTSDDVNMISVCGALLVTSRCHPYPLMAPFSFNSSPPALIKCTGSILIIVICKKRDASPPTPEKESGVEMATVQAAAIHQNLSQTPSRAPMQYEQVSTRDTDPDPLMGV